MNTNFHTATIGHFVHDHSAELRKFVYFFFAAMVLLVAGLLFRPTLQRAFNTTSMSFDHIGEGVEFAAPQSTVIGQALPEASIPQAFEPVLPAENPNQPLTADAKRIAFAKMEVHRYAGLLPVLTARMERESNAQMRERMRVSVESLARTIAATELASNRLRSLNEGTNLTARNARLPFARESLRESLLAMQDAGQMAVSAFIDADNEASNRAGTTPVAVFRDQLGS